MIVERYVKILLTPETLDKCKEFSTWEPDKSSFSLLFFFFGKWNVPFNVKCN